MQCCFSFVPHSESFKLWDAFISIGFHFVPLVMVARILVLKKEIMKCDNDYTAIKTLLDEELRLKPFKASIVLEKAKRIFLLLSKEFRHVILLHTTDLEIAKSIKKNYKKK